MGYYVAYELEITPRPNLEAIGQMGRARRVLEREGVELSNQIRQFFAEPINEAIYQALFNEQIVFALGRSLLGGGERSSQWHDHEDDMRKLSAAAPDHLFTLTGQGEDADDRWRKYFKAGKMQEARAKVSFGEFDESELA